MSEHVPVAKIKKPRHQKVVPLSEQGKNVPVEVERVDIPSHMGRTRSGTHHSPEVWGNRVYGSGDRKHPNAKPD